MPDDFKVGDRVKTKALGPDGKWITGRVTDVRNETVWIRIDGKFPGYLYPINRLTRECEVINAGNP